MISFIIIFLISLIEQSLFVISFTFIEPFHGIDIKMMIPLMTLVIFMVLYFNFSKYLHKLLKIDKEKFDMSYLVSWFVCGYITSYLILAFEPIKSMLPTNGGEHGGLEYILVPFFIGIYYIILLIYKFISYLLITKKNNKKDK